MPVFLSFEPLPVKMFDNPLNLLAKLVNLPDLLNNVIASANLPNGPDTNDNAEPKILSPYASVKYPPAIRPKPLETSPPPKYSAIPLNVLKKNSSASFALSATHLKDSNPSRKELKSNLLNIVLKSLNFSMI